VSTLVPLFRPSARSSRHLPRCARGCYEGVVSGGLRSVGQYLQPPSTEERLGALVAAPSSVACRWPHLHRDRAHRCHTCAGDWAHLRHIHAGTGLTAAISALELGSSAATSHRDWSHPLPTSAAGLGSPLATAAATSVQAHVRGARPVAASRRAAAEGTRAAARGALPPAVSLFHLQPEYPYVPYSTRRCPYSALQQRPLEGALACRSLGDSLQRGRFDVMAPLRVNVMAPLRR
jgi:hypothetical protein